MKKYFSFILGFLGLGVVAYIVMQGWATFDLPMAGIKSHPIPGYKFSQGIMSISLSVLALILLFLKPKIAIAPALLAAAIAAWFYLSKPVVDEIVHTPEKIVIGAIVGAVLIALAGLIAPKKAA